MSALWMTRRILAAITLLCFASCGGSGNGGNQGSSAILLFRVNNMSGSTISVVKGDGSSASLNTLGSDATWSPDGKSIALTQGDIFVMKADGSGLTQLTHDAHPDIVSDFDFAPHWAPNGREIAFTAECCGIVDPGLSVRVINNDGSGLLVVASGITGAWSPDGSKVLTVVGDPSLPVVLSNIAVAASDGSGSINLTNLTVANAISISPVWSPDGSKVAFASERALDGSNAGNLNGTMNIWLVNADGTGARPLTQLTAAGANSSSPAWSPDGSKIAFVSARALDGSNAANFNGTTNIWIMSADGSGTQALTMLTASSASSQDPDWSSDGSKLAFDSFRTLNGSNSANASSNIWTIQPNGAGAAPLTNSNATGTNNTNPKWRP